MRLTFLRALLGIMLVMFFTSVVAGKDATDVDPSHPAYEAIHRLLEVGLMRTEDGKFHGDRLVNRYQLAWSLGKLLGPRDAATRPAFSDVSVDHWAADGIAVALGAGVLQGYDGRFHGDKIINRYQMAVLTTNTLRALGFSTGETDAALSFPDVAKTHWAYKAVREATGRGVMQTMKDGKFDGDGLVDRYQWAGILTALVNLRGWKNSPPGGARIGVGNR